ncbi:MAG: hypothetical protein WAZ12_00220 [Candidatus Absconditicoccaceae bacterium]
MFFSKTLYDRIFREIAENQEHTIQTLHKVINKKEEKISLPNFYKIIDNLLENQILTKEQGKLKLHTAWILSLFELNNKVRETYIENTLKLDLKEGEQKTFYASSLIDIDNIRAELLSIIALKGGKTESLYMYNSHLYHILGMPETETTNFKNMSKQMQKVYLLVGNESVMDQYAANIIKLQGIDIVCSDKTKFLKDGYFINIIGEYMIEALFPDIINQYFKAFFDNIKNLKDFNPELFQNIFKMKAEIKITIRRSKSQTDSLKKEIKKFFK